MRTEEEILKEYKRIDKLFDKETYDHLVVYGILIALQWVLEKDRQND